VHGRARAADAQYVPYAVIPRTCSTYITYASNNAYGTVCAVHVPSRINALPVRYARGNIATCCSTHYGVAIRCAVRYTVRTVHIAVHAVRGSNAVRYVRALRTVRTYGLCTLYVRTVRYRYVRAVRYVRTYGTVHMRTCSTRWRIRHIRDTPRACPGCVRPSLSGFQVGQHLCEDLDFPATDRCWLVPQLSGIARLRFNSSSEGLQRGPQRAF
jgi:hypothetical protein